MGLDTPWAAAPAHRPRAEAILQPMQDAPADAAPPVPESVRELFPALYRELRRLARLKLSSGGRHTLLDTSALIHEAFLRMQREGGVQLKDREHFLAYAATTMRNVVIDFLRRRNAERRGGGVEHVTLDTRSAAQLGAQDDEILAVHEALQSLEQIDPRLVQLVEMRYFAGLSDLEIAGALGVTDRTVRRHWERARLMLAEILGR
jgi:RNA polymerase sigma factor (TIGR02999 family)